MEDVREWFSYHPECIYYSSFQTHLLATKWCVWVVRGCCSRLDTAHITSPEVRDREHRGRGPWVWGRQQRLCSSVIITSKLWSFWNWFWIWGKKLVTVRKCFIYVYYNFSPGEAPVSCKMWGSGDKSWAGPGHWAVLAPPDGGSSSSSGQVATLVLQKVASELHPKVRNHGEGPY